MQSRKLLKTLTLAAGLSMFAVYGIACAYLWAHQEDLIFMQAPFSDRCNPSAKNDLQ